MDTRSQTVSAATLSDAVPRRSKRARLPPAPCPPQRAPPAPAPPRRPTPPRKRKLEQEHPLPCPLRVTQAQLLEERHALDAERAQVEGMRADLQAEIARGVERGVLARVEDKLTCPLCLEIIACPYVLSPALCGHSFCGECILKWFFSVLHDECGCWHESATCPSCRALLPYTKYDPPRPAALLPFAPNRALDKFVADVAAGLDRQRHDDWVARNDAGRRFMRELFAKWELCTAEDFVKMKRKLGL